MLIVRLYWAGDSLKWCMNHATIAGLIAQMLTCSISEVNQYILYTLSVSSFVRGTVRILVHDLIEYTIIFKSITPIYGLLQAISVYSRMAHSRNNSGNSNNLTNLPLTKFQLRVQIY